MLNSSAAAPATDALLFFDEERRLVAGKRLIDQLAKLAEVSNTEIVRFSNEISNAFGRWLLSNEAQTAPVVDVLNEVLDATSGLRRLLEEHSRVPSFDMITQWEMLRKNFQPMNRERALFAAFGPMGYLSAGLTQCQHSRNVSIPELAADLSVLAEATRKAKELLTGRAGAGGPVGPRNFPGLYRLIVMLEYAAQIAGGSFSLNERDRKGALLDALDWLRAEFLKRPETEWIGALLPPRGRHPVSTYARILADARRAASEYTPPKMGV
jgi:hypothetical protein